jgi:hypothetical protein
LVGKTGNFAGLTQAILPADLLLTDSPEVPPLPPTTESSTTFDKSSGAQPDAAEREAEIDLAEEEAALEPTPTSTLISPPILNPTSAPMPNPAPRVPFEELWKLNPRGGIGYGRAAYLRLRDAQTHAAKADLLRLLKRGPLPEGFDYAATHFGMIRIGQPAAPILAPAEPSVRVPAQEYIREGTAEWRAWQRHLQATTGSGSPVDKRGGWHFPSRLPPLP